ncbi:MAG TPA: FecR domain-containing protein [Verrucomicrobiae bacterium]|nr:FecR domain-containing protein [Verrucomicrobiae bacterium]
MKSARFLYLAAVSALVFTFGANTFAQSKPGYATVVRISGEARYSADDAKTWQPLVVGMTLGAGNVIETAGNGTVDLVLGQKLLVHSVQNPSIVAPAADSPVTGLSTFKSAAEQNVIHMDTDTVLAIDTLTIGDTGVDAVSDTELDLRQGTIFGTVKKLSATSQYLIKMPNGIAGVRGTTFAISANGDITVISGSMVVSHTNAAGQVTTTVLGPGEELNPRTGEVRQLTPVELTRVENRAVFIITLDYGFIRFAHDRTILYISPTTGHF